MGKSKEELSESLGAIAVSLKGIRGVLRDHYEGIHATEESRKLRARYKPWLPDYDGWLRAMAKLLLKVVPDNVAAIRVTDTVVVMRPQEKLRAMGEVVGMTLEEVDQYAQDLAGKMGGKWDPVFPQN